MLKRFVQACAIAAAAISAAPCLAAATDTLTGLPLYTSATFASKDVTNVCGTQVSNSTYGVRQGDLATVDAWFASRLHGFKLIHGTTRNYPYDIYVNGDLTMSVTIMGSGAHTGVEAVVYHRNARPASPKNLSNWLDGSDPLCH